MARVVFIILIASVTGLSAFTTVVPSFGKPKHKLSALHASKDSVDAFLQRAFTPGTLVEFSEKKRAHVGRIINVEHKSNGDARYEIIDHDGKKFSIADKAVSYAMPNTPNDERRAKQLFDDFVSAFEESDFELRTDLDISPELLEMAWEEALQDESHEMTPNSLVDLIHSHTASAIESYKAWKLLRTGMAHVFFKEIKDHGRVVAFKAKASNAVEAARKTFCTNSDNAEDEFCWV